MLRCSDCISLGLHSFTPLDSGAVIHCFDPSLLQARSLYSLASLSACIDLLYYIYVIYPSRRVGVLRLSYPCGSGKISACFSSIEGSTFISLTERPPRPQDNWMSSRSTPSETEVGDLPETILHGLHKNTILTSHGRPPW